MSPAIRLLAFFVAVAAVSAVAALAGAAFGPEIDGSEPARHGQAADHMKRSP